MLLKMITESFARCIAKISGDGNLYYRYVRYNNTCKELLDEFEEDIKAEFGDVTIYKGIGNSGTSFVQVYKKHIIQKFLEYLPSYKSSDIRIPLEIKKSEKKIKKQYLRALYDDEGSPCLRIFSKTKEWKRNLTLTSNSTTLLNDVKRMLLGFSIRTSNLRRNNNYSTRDKSYYIGITGKSNFVRFKE